MKKLTLNPKIKIITDETNDSFVVVKPDQFFTSNPSSVVQMHLLAIALSVVDLTIFDMMYFTYNDVNYAILYDEFEIEYAISFNKCEVHIHKLSFGEHNIYIH